MKNTGELYRFEIRKILKNRLTIAMLAVTVIFIIIEAFIPRLYMSEGPADSRMELDGAVIDEALLQEMYPRLIDNGTVWTAENSRYKDIADMEKGILPNNAVISDYSADEMYRIREESIISGMEDDKLTDGELAWWKSRLSLVEVPFTYRCFQGAVNIAQGMSLTLMCIMLISAICLSTVFTVEHRNRTDQIVMSCRNGRGTTYFAKMAAGLSVVTGCCIFSAALLTALVAALYGLGGLNGAVQLELPWSAYPFTFGRFILIQMIVLLSASVLFAAFAMAMSEIIKNSLAVTGIMIGLFIFSQLELIPPQYRVLAQIKSMLPSNQISLWSLMEHRLVGFDGHFVTSYVASPVIYVIISVIFIISGKIAFDRFQVTGR